MFIAAIIWILKGVPREVPLVAGTFNIVQSLSAIGKSSKCKTLFLSLFGADDDVCKLLPTKWVVHTKAQPI